jgi:glycosyltransferase involved in cell wall biosynthesis
MSHTLVSVIMPSFKMGQFIGEALDSVGAQTYPHWEVIVVDDAGPEDGTRAAVETFAAKHADHRVEYIRHETNQGVSVARRTAYGAARGTYLAFLDADDAFLPQKLARHVADLITNPDCVLVHGPILDEAGHDERSAPDKHWFYHGENSHSYSHRAKPDYLRDARICNSTITCLASRVMITDFPAQTMFQIEDWLLWMLLSGRGKFYYDSQPLTKYRRHGEAASAIFRSKPASFAFARIEFLLLLLQRSRGLALQCGIARELLRCLGEIVWNSADVGSEMRKGMGMRLRCALLCAALKGPAK